LALTVSLIEKMDFKSRILNMLFVTSVLGLPFGCTGNSGSNSANDRNPAARGQQIIDEYLKRDASPYRKDRIRFTVTDEDNTQKVYEIEKLAKTNSRGNRHAQ
jgi:hypothetical protein